MSWWIGFAICAIDGYLTVTSFIESAEGNLLLRIVMLAHLITEISLAVPYLTIPFLKYLTLLALAILFSPCLICYLAQQELDASRNQSYRDEESESIDESSID